MSICIQVEASAWDGATEEPDLKLQPLRDASSPQGATVPPRQPGLGSYYIARAQDRLGIIDVNRWISNTPELALEDGVVVDDWQVVQAVWTPSAAAAPGTIASIFTVTRGPNPVLGDFQVAFDKRKFVDAADPASANVVQVCWPLWTGAAIGVRSDWGQVVPPDFLSIVLSLVKIRDIAEPCPTPSAPLPFLPSAPL